MLIDIAVDHARVELKIGDGAVAVAGGTFGAINGFVDIQLAASELAEHVDDAIHPLGVVLAAHKGAGGDGARIHHGIEGTVVALVKGDRVEGVAGGFDADLLQNRLLTVIFKGKAIDHGLGDRLDGEQSAGVAYLVNEAVRGGEGDAKLVRIH